VVGRITGVRLLGYLYEKYKYPNNLIPAVLPTYTASEDGPESSETSAYKIQTPGNHPKEIIQHSKQDESLKSKLITYPTNQPHEEESFLRCYQFLSWSKKSPYFTEPGGS
jgi:hypothetical protein